MVAAAAAKSLQSCLTLCDTIDGSPPGSPVPGILQARTLEWVAISSSNACMHAKSLQSCPTLCDPMDSSPPGSSVHGILISVVRQLLHFLSISLSYAPCLSVLHVGVVYWFSVEFYHTCCHFWGYPSFQILHIFISQSSVLIFFHLFLVFRSFIN